MPQNEECEHKYLMSPGAALTVGVDAFPLVLFSHRIYKCLVRIGYVGILRKGYTS